jgi:hypothetical protein
MKLLQVPVWNLGSSQDAPPNSGCCVMGFLRVFHPPPQELSQVDQEPQLSSTQGIGHLVIPHAFAS